MYEHKVEIEGFVGTLGILSKLCRKPKNQIMTNRPMPREWMCTTFGDGVVDKKGAVVLEAAVSKRKDSENQKPTVIRSCEDEIKPKNNGTKSEMEQNQKPTVDLKALTLRARFCRRLFVRCNFGKVGLVEINNFERIKKRVSRCDVVSSILDITFHGCSWLRITWFKDP